MANPIHCDWAGCELLADVMVSRLADGETTAWCGAHYVGIAQAVVSAAELAEPELAEQVAAERDPPLEPTEAQVEVEDERIAERLTRYAASQAADPEAPISSGGESEDLGDSDAGPSDPVAADTPDPGVGDTSPGPAPEPSPNDQLEPAVSEASQPAPAPEPAGPTVVRKGTSASRRRHEAKQRAKARDQKEASQ